MGNPRYMESRSKKPFFAGYNRISDSIYYGTKEPGRELLNHDLITGKPVEPKEGEVNLLFADPMFDESKMKEKRFVFKPGSPALKLGIESIDLHDVGSSLVHPKK